MNRITRPIASEVTFVLLFQDPTIVVLVHQTLSPVASLKGLRYLDDAVGAVTERTGGVRPSRRRSWALAATTMVETLFRIASTAGRR